MLYNREQFMQKDSTLCLNAEDQKQPSPAVRDCIFIIFAATFRILKGKREYVVTYHFVLGKNLQTEHETTAIAR